jgi:CopG family nickel-responsive transcriptional regulator
MRRLTISVDDDLADAFDTLIANKRYANRSEAFRDLVRTALNSEELGAARAAHCVATLSYVYNHHERQLAARLTSMQHEHHDVTVAAMHAHLDHDNCIETLILRGSTREVQAFADEVIAQTGVRHGRLHMIPARQQKGGHAHFHPSA